MSLSCLSLILGAILILSSAFVFVRPEQTRKFLKAFPRSLPIGYFFLIVSTVWFLYYFSLENVSDFAAMKKPMFIAFIVIAVGVGLYVKDFLAVRAYSIFMFLAAKLIYDTARYADCSWAVLFPSVATVLVIFGMWFTATPCRMRDVLNWLTDKPKRLNILAGFRALLGVIFIILGIMGVH